MKDRPVFEQFWVDICDRHTTIVPHFMTIDDTAVYKNIFATFNLKTTKFL
jgi:hypothetical protein